MQGLFKLYLNTILHRAITSTHIDKGALLGARADAAHIRRIGGCAATGLGLVIAEDKEAVGAGLELGTKKRLVGVRITPTADIIARLDTHIVKGTDWFIRLSRIGRILKKVIGKPFRRGGATHAIDHD